MPGRSKSMKWLLPILLLMLVVTPRVDAIFGKFKNAMTGGSTGETGSTANCDCPCREYWTIKCTLEYKEECKQLYTHEQCKKIPKKTPLKVKQTECRKCVAFYETVYETATERKCFPVFDEQCQTEYPAKCVVQQQCTMLYHTECNVVGYKSQCKQKPVQTCSPITKCHRTPQTKCVAVQKEKCVNQPKRVPKQQMRSQCLPYEPRPPPETCGQSPQPPPDAYGPPKQPRTRAIDPADYYAALGEVTPDPVVAAFIPFDADPSTLLAASGAQSPYIPLSNNDQNIGNILMYDDTSNYYPAQSPAQQLIALTTSAPGIDMHDLMTNYINAQSAMTDQGGTGRSMGDQDNQVRQPFFPSRQVSDTVVQIVSAPSYRNFKPIRGTQQNEIITAAEEVLKDQVLTLANNMEVDMPGHEAMIKNISDSPSSPMQQILTASFAVVTDPKPTSPTLPTTPITTPRTPTTTTSLKSSTTKSRFRPKLKFGEKLEEDQKERDAKSVVFGQDFETTVKVKGGSSVKRKRKTNFPNIILASDYEESSEKENYDPFEFLTDGIDRFIKTHE